MFKKQITVNIDELDLKISKLNEELAVEENEEKLDKLMSRLEKLVDLRYKLSESKHDGSIKPLVVSGLFGLASVVVVLKYEQTEVITSKAFSTAMNMFRGSK